MRSAEPRTFRATLEAWLGQLLLPLVFYAMLTFTAIRFTGMSMWIGAISLGILLPIVGIEFVLPMARSWLLIDERSMEGSINGRFFHVYWTEVLAAWMHSRKNQSFLCLGTRDGTIIVPLRFMNDVAVWECVQSHALPAALLDTAMQCLPDYKEWDDARKQAFDNTEPAMVTDHWLIQVVGWAGLTFFMFGLLNSVPQGHVFFGIVSGVLALSSGIMLLSWGITQVCTEKIERFTLFGGWRINWDDVRSIEIGPLDSVLVLVGDDRQLVIPGPGIWSGSGKRAVLSKLLAQAEKRHIPLRRTPWAVLRATRDTRIKK